MPEFRLKAKTLVCTPGTLEVTVDADTPEEAYAMAVSQANNARPNEVETIDDGWVDFDEDGDPSDAPVKVLSIDGEEVEKDGQDDDDDDGQGLDLRTLFTLLHNAGGQQ